ncbi:putative nuclease HARBI1 [Scomber scombrus]|uniref:putative nuclease HARBI1 n=1 Tax=Scomber scombrus TaxID=13677 RepID=UPI002DDB6D05|nr:putative nuclease HARBI1 [Scomber scombrus]
MGNVIVRNGMAYLLLLDALARQGLGRERVFRDREDVFAETDEWLMQRFRLPCAVLLDICNLLQPNLTKETRRSNPVLPHVQVLTVLGFLATGTFQREIGDRAGVSQSSVSCALPSVIKGLITLSPRHIRFPYTAVDQLQIKQDFYNMAQLPNIIGAIDCTHIRIKAPSPDPFPFLNRKQYHSINVQLISDSKYNLLNVVARWPGGAHDSFVFQNSTVGTRLAQGAHGDGWLIADRGYGLVPWLMTPLANPQSRQEHSYNRRHTVTLPVVERTIGVLKARWRCLDTSGGKLLYTPEKSCQIIMACCVLHNIAMKEGVALPDPTLAEDMPDDVPEGLDRQDAIRISYPPQCAANLLQTLKDVLLVFQDRIRYHLCPWNSPGTWGVRRAWLRSIRRAGLQWRNGILR